MKVLFITAPYKFKDVASLGADIKTDILPPLGLAYIAAILENKNHTVKILDLPILDYTTKDVMNYIREFKPDFIGFYSTTPTINNLFKLIKKIAKATDAILLIGGPHASSFPEDTLKKCSELDIVTVGESEYTVNEILDCLKNNKSLSEVRGIYYREGKKIVSTPKRDPIRNLDELPFPARHLLDLDKYVPLPNQYKRLPLTNMITAKGCPYHCTFCFEAGTASYLFRRHSPEYVVSEVVECIKKYGIKEIDFYDDVFTANRLWLEKFCDLLIKENLDVVWSCYGRVDTVTKELLEKMKRAGCWNIFYGIESGNQELLDKIQKGTTIEQVENAVRWTKEVGIEVRGAFILGLPGETPEMGKKTINFAIKLDLDYAQFSFATPFYGTKMYEQAKKEGTLLTYDPKKYNFNEPIFVPRAYKDKEQLKSLFKQAYRNFYLRPSYVLKHIKRINGLQDIKKYWIGLKLAIDYSFLHGG